MKTRITQNILLLLLLMAARPAAFAQGLKPDSKVSGTLSDEQGKPVDYATVSLLNAKDSSLARGTLSNDAGKFLFEHVSPGTYILKATAVGFQKAAGTPFTITPNTLTELPALKMQRARSALKTVNVSASKPLIERKIDRTVMNVENSVLAAGNSALEILERAPGVTIDKDDNISLKGKQGVTVMINDKLTYLTSSQLAALLRSTDGATISTIEIISNPSAKYDAAGNAGIINIKLKKNKQGGTNGSLTAGIGYGAYGKDNSTLSLNHKEGDLNLFGSFSRNDNKRVNQIGINRTVTDTSGKTTYFNQHTSLPQSSHNNSYRLGADYDLSKNNTIGFLISGYFNGEDAINTNNTNIGRNYTQPDSSLSTTATIHGLFHNIALNLNDTYKLDTAGQQISADLDVSKFRNENQSTYITNFYLPNGSLQHPEGFLGNLTPSVIAIHTAKADYAKPLSKTFKLEAGGKFSDVKTDNNLEQALAAHAALLSSNHFIYDEKVGAGYLNLSKEYKTTSIQAGLRAEYTQSNAHGDSANVTQIIPRSYIDLFPSVFINHTINQKNEINLSYSRRIDRPQYDNLNPFVYHLDPYTYQKGNPYLKPQYTNNFEFNYTYNKLVNISLGYSHVTDVITEVPGTDPVSKVSFVTQLNLQVQNSYNVNVFSPYTISKWWTGNFNATGFYLGFKSKGLEGGNLNRGQFAYQARTTQTFSPIDGYKAELTANYQSELTYGLFSVKPQYATDAGISHSFASKKASVKLSMSDIFNTRTNNVSSNYQSNDLHVMQKNETRITRLTFTYNFGNRKIQARQHRTGADDEKGRVKGAN